MEKVTLEQFCELAECSKQLVGVYVAKGMPKYQMPENKKKNLYDLMECQEWAENKGHKSFSNKIVRASDKWSVLRFQSHGKAADNESAAPSTIESDNGMQDDLDAIEFSRSPKHIKSDNGKSFPGGLEEIIAMLNTINRKLDDKPRRKRNWKHYLRAWKRIQGRNAV